MRCSIDNHNLYPLASCARTRLSSSCDEPASQIVVPPDPHLRTQSGAANTPYERVGRTHRPARVWSSDERHSAAPMLTAALEAMAEDRAAAATAGAAMPHTPVGGPACRPSPTRLRQSDRQRTPRIARSGRLRKPQGRSRAARSPARRCCVTRLCGGGVPRILLGAVCGGSHLVCSQLKTMGVVRAGDGHTAICVSPQGDGGTGATTTSRMVHTALAIVVRRRLRHHALLQPSVVR